jgi:hypothetical protein
VVGHLKVKLLYPNYAHAFWLNGYNQWSAVDTAQDFNKRFCLSYKTFPIYWPISSTCYVSIVQPLHLLPLSKPVFSHSLAIIGSFLNQSIRLHASLPGAQQFCGGVIHEAITLMRNKPPPSNEGSFGFYCNTQSSQQYPCWGWSVLDIQSLSSFTKNKCVNSVNLIIPALLFRAPYRFHGMATHNVLVRVITRNL